MIQFEEEKCVVDILQEYPPLSHPAVVSCDLTVLCTCTEVITPINTEDCILL